jgi:hypothetical protein
MCRCTVVVDVDVSDLFMCHGAHHITSLSMQYKENHLNLIYSPVTTLISPVQSCGGHHIFHWCLCWFVIILWFPFTSSENPHWEMVTLRRDIELILRPFRSMKWCDSTLTGSMPEWNGSRVAITANSTTLESVILILHDGSALLKVLWIISQAVQCHLQFINQECTYISLGMCAPLFMAHSICNVVHIVSMSLGRFGFRKTGICFHGGRN